VVNDLKKKRENNSKNALFSLSVESPGIEPGSKQAIKKLSTRLFPDWIFVMMAGQEQPHQTYLLCCQNSPEA